MLQRCAQLFSRFGIRHALAGQGLPERMRTATVALLGVTAAISMAFVAVIAQQGWTVLSLGPIPTPFVGPQAVGDGTALNAGEGGSVAPTGGQPGLVATAELAAGSQGAQPGRAPAQPPAGTLSGSHPVAVPQQGGGPQGTPPPEGGEGGPAAGEAPPSPAGTPTAPGAGKGTAGVGGEEDEGEVEEEVPSTPPPPVESPPEEEVEEPEEEAPSESWGGWHGHGHGHGHHHDW